MTVLTIGYKTQLDYQEKLLKTLDKVTNTYKKVTGKKDILIVIEFIPPPPITKNCLPDIETQ